MAVPNKEVNSALWLFQLVCTLFSAVLGLIGMVITLLIIFFLLAKLKPLGVHYLAPYTTLRPIQLDDSIVKFPASWIKHRPFYLAPKDKRRAR